MILNYFSSRLTICIYVGTLAGLSAALWGSLAQALQPGAVWTLTELLLLTLMIGTLTFVVICVLLIGIFRYKASSVAGPTFVNVFAVTAVTLIAIRFLAQPPLNAVIGFVVGWIIGALLCWLCRNREDVTHVN